MEEDFGRRLLAQKRRVIYSGGDPERYSWRGQEREETTELTPTPTAYLRGGSGGGFYYRQMQAELDAAAEARKRDRRQSQMALLGGGIGFAAGGPTGAMVGMGIGSMIGGGCIIISACTSSNSYEVEIAREYRDNILDRVTLGGYYALCNVTVPLIHKSKLFKRFIKRFLVDRMIDYFEVALNYKSRTEFRTSELITKAFLNLCHLIGRNVDHKVWIFLHT